MGKEMTRKKPARKRVFWIVTGWRRSFTEVYQDDSFANDVCENLNRMHPKGKFKVLKVIEVTKERKGDE